MIGKKNHVILYQDGIDVCIGTNWRTRLLNSSRPINIKRFDWEYKLTDEEKTSSLSSFSKLTPHRQCGA